MTTAPTNLAAASTKPDPVQRKLRAAWSRKRLRTHLVGMGRLTVGLLVLILIDCLIDWLLLPPPAWRTALLVVNALLIACLAWRWWWRELERYDQLRMALRVERSYPRLSNLLVTYVQVRPERGADRSASPALLAAARRQAAQATGPMDFRAIVRFDDLHRPLILLGIVCLAFALAVLTHPEHFRVAAFRLLSPGSQLAYPTKTRIASVTGDLFIAPGGSVRLEAVVERTVPDTGQLQVRTGDGPWRSLGVSRGPEDRFSRQIDNVRDSFAYRWRIGDDRSATYRVRAVRPPRIEAIHVEQQFPQAAGGQTRTVDQLNMQVPRGTKLLWRVTFDRPVDQAALWRLADEADHADTDGRVGLCPVSIVNGRQLQAAWVADESVQYGMALRYSVGENGRAHRFVYDDPLTYSIQLVADAPPQVELVDPPDPSRIATINKRVSLRYRASDDRGVLAANVIFRVNGGSEQRYELARYDGQRYVEDQRDWQVRDSLPELRPGDQVWFAVEVVDQAGPREDEPVAARSAAQQMTIVTLAEYQQAVMEQLQDVRHELESARQSEAEAVEQLKTIQQEASP